MKNFTLVLFAVICSNLSAQKINLWNGKDLKGWHVDVPAADNNPNIKPSFIVREGNLVSMGVPEGHIITDAIYNDYILEVQYRFPSKPGNCGVLVHASTPRKLYKMFPQSIEVQMMHGHAGDFWVIGEDITVDNMEKYRGDKEKWGSIEGKNRQIVATKMMEKPLGKWNKMKIECRDRSISVWVNGTLVNQGYNCTANKGQIAIQAEGAEVEFKKVVLKKLNPD
jgi:hypothetical protein